MPTGSETFYADLPSLTEFGGFADFDAYAPLPDDWVIMAGDIRGSTRAIEAGHYKDVNMLGAAVITAVLNACPGDDLPFVFGGDGGAVAVPGSRAESASRALARLQHDAQPAFGLSLRAAAVPVARIRRDGHDVRVRRYRLNAQNHLAMFAGGGIEHVDEILKDDSGDPDQISAAPGPVDLGGLSCRWEPLMARHGQMIALMVLPVGPEPAAGVYGDFLEILRTVLEDRILAHAPARDDTMRFRWPPRGLALEARTRALKGGRLLRHWLHAAMTAGVQKWTHWRGSEIGGYHGVRYLEELKAQTDFRKYDGCLRTVLDCSPAQTEAIRDWLERAYRSGRLVYGLHTDTTALMTCLVFSLEDSEHVHFIDAAGGGFARAATGFKARLAEIRGRVSPP